MKRTDVSTADKKQGPVCLVFGDGVTMLGVIRSLGRGGVPLVGVTNAGDLSAWSRWQVPRGRQWGDAPNPGTLREWLTGLPIPGAVLMPCSDNWTKSVAELPESVKARFRTWGPSSNVIEVLVNKDRFRKKLEELDLPHPRTFNLDSAEEVSSVPDAVFDNAFLKPHESQSFFAKYAVKGLFVRSHSEAKRRVNELFDEGFRVVLQEYVPGPANAHVFVDGFRPMRGGKTRYLARRRLRMYPADFGNSTDMITVPLGDVQGAIDTIEALFESIGYHGIFSAEFKYDERDAAFKILEVNCRPWWYVEFADRCGLHACKFAYQDAMSLPLDDYHGYRIGKRGVYPLFDRSARKENRKKGLSESTSIAMLVTWLFAYKPIFAWDDPIPGLRTFFRHAKTSLAALFGTGSAKDSP